MKSPLHFNEPQFNPEGRLHLKITVKKNLLNSIELLLGHLPQNIWDYKTKYSFYK